MLKRGQVAVFAIIGIVALAAFIFVFFLFEGFREKTRQITHPAEYLKTQIEDVKRVVDTCMKKETHKVLNTLYAQGGRLSPLRSLPYYTKKISLLCIKIKSDTPCYQMMFTKDDVLSELKPELERKVLACVTNGLLAFRDKDYRLTTGTFYLNLEEFNEKALVLKLEYPLSLNKANVTETQHTFVAEIPTTFWKTISLTRLILNKETLGQPVDLNEMSSTNPYFRIASVQIDHGLVYMIAPRQGNEAIFYFGVET